MDEGRTRVNPWAQVLDPGALRSPPSIDHGRKLVPADLQTILSRWRRLAPQNPIARQKTSTLVDDEEDRNIALGSRGKDAATVINDKVGPDDLRSLPRLTVFSTRLEGIKGKSGSDRTKSHAFKSL